MIEWTPPELANRFGTPSNVFVIDELCSVI